MNRRDFLNRLGAGATTLAISALSRSELAWAQSVPSLPSQDNSNQRLRVVQRSLEVNGRAAKVLGLTQPNGSPGLILDAGSNFDVSLSNEIKAPTLIHWHGLTPPWSMDGVPDNPAALLHPGETRRYSFPVGAGGTHWMHAHTLQEQSLLAAPLIVRTAADRARDEQEVVVLLHDFSFASPEELLAKLKGKSAGASMSHGGQGMDHSAMMKGMAMKPEAMSKAAMGQMDLNDIEYDAYLANDRTLDDPEVFSVQTGGRVRLRIINGATATAFTIDTGRLEASLIAVDGQDVVPVVGRSFPISMGQRLDLRLEIPKDAGAFPILALREGARERTGIVLASAGASVGKIAKLGEANGPVVGLDLEQRLKPLQPLAPRAADRKVVLTLTGNMVGYSWAIEGGDMLRVRRGERVEISLTNMSMMAHPMHLHGHHFQVLGINGTPVDGAVRDTVLVPPMASVNLAFDAENPGRWPFHCHHLYHMATGMMAFVEYSA